MDKQIFCIIQAFACEETIEAAMQSLLDQTYKNWRCFIVNNGNTDRSFDIIKNFSARDARFIVLNKSRNDTSISWRMLLDVAKRFPDSFLCTLDADDIYKSDFFERAVNLAEKNELDIVACGTEVTLKKNASSRKEKLLKRRELATNLVVRKENFTNMFRSYKSFFNEMWGKLYRGKILANIDGGDLAYKTTGRCMPDLWFIYEVLSKCNAIGVISGASHKYYQYIIRDAMNATNIVHFGSASVFGIDRYSVYDTYDIMMGFLSRHGDISPALYEYMQAVLFSWLEEFYFKALLPMPDEAMVAQHIDKLISEPKFDELMTYRDTGAYDNLRGFVARKAFLERLKYFLIGQQYIRNCVSSANVAVLCEAPTIRLLNKSIEKLTVIRSNIDKITEGSLTSC